MSHHGKKCKFGVNEAGRVVFETPMNIALCFISQTYIRDPNNRFNHISDTLIINDIDPNVDFTEYAHLRGCAFRTVEKNTETDTFLHFYRHLPKGSETESEINSAIVKANQLYDLAQILTDFNLNQINSYMEYVEMKLNYEASSHIKNLYSIAKKMLEYHKSIVLESGDFFQNVMEYYRVSKQFKESALKKGSLYSDYSFDKNTPLDKFKNEKDLIVALASLFLGYSGLKYVMGIVNEVKDIAVKEYGEKIVKEIRLKKQKRTSKANERYKTKRVSKANERYKSKQKRTSKPSKPSMPRPTKSTNSSKTTRTKRK